MKVKITKATLDTFWYADKIGETFEIREDCHCVVTDGKHIIYLDDCVVVEETDESMKEPS